MKNNNRERDKISTISYFIYSSSMYRIIVYLFPAHVLQESRAIAKKTARCALYMDALKNFESPWLRPRLLFMKLLMGFCCNRS